MVEGEPNENVADNLFAANLVEESYEREKDITKDYMVSMDHMEASNESTVATPNSQDNVFRELGGCALSPFRQMRTFEMARKKHNDAPLRKGRIMMRTTHKSVPCLAALKKIKFSINHNKNVELFFMLFVLCIHIGNYFIGLDYSVPVCILHYSNYL